ncbi:hypothetical protein WMY93_024463 [Mugilogobius chulae]|uniref:DUF4590 domain-containing protein n=1 Tax=Mugilogobius chulae TaxID=88201 RepID=A0AAW0N1C9_9GOBI
MSHSHLNPGLISAYNSLTDKHLAGYFSNTRIRRHLQRAGLITRSGRIVPDKEYRQKLIQKAHQRHVRECLAQAIFHKVLEMERLHQIEIKRKLEEFARRERVHKIKVERSKRYEEDIIRILSPRPPTGARGVKKQHSGPEGEHTESSESPGSSRPNTAPGKMQRPVRLKPLHSNSTTASQRHSSPYRRHENQRPFNGTLDKDSHRRFNSMEVRNGVSPYCLPVINNFVTPVPPSTKRKERPVKLSTSSTHRGRRLRPTTASSGADASEDLPMLRSSVPQSRVCVNMVYLGKAVRVFQQHCGGENLCVYKGKLREGESFQFISRRHRGFPFSLTFFLNGLQVERLSSCCEFKHRKSSRLGGRHGHFAFTGIEAASPCYKCIIAMEDSKVKDDYEEDFEADDEGPVEEENENKSTSPNKEKEEKEKETNASGSEDNEKDDDRQSHSGSSFSGSESEAEEVKEAKAEEEQDQPKTHRKCKRKLHTWRPSQHRPLSLSLLRPKTRPSGNENRAASDTQTAAEGERRTEDEPERGEVSGAILKESHCSSEPELSDSSTETTEVGSNKSTEKETKDFFRNRQDEDTGEKETSEEVVEEVTQSPLQDELKKEASKDGEESEQEALSIQKQDESLGVDTKPDEIMERDNTDALTVTETIEMKAEASDTQEPINAEVAPAIDTVENTGQESQVSAKNEIENVDVTNKIEVDKEKDTDLIEDKTQEEVDDGENTRESQKESLAKEAITDLSTEEQNKDESTEEQNKDESTEEQNKDKSTEEQNKDESTEEQNKDESTEEQNKDEDVRSEPDDLRNHKPEREPINEETKQTDTDLNMGDQEGDGDKALSEKEVTCDSPKEEIKAAADSGVQNGHKEKDVEKLDESEKESTIQKEEEEKQEEVKADSVKLEKENVKSDEDADVVGEASKEILCSAHVSDDLQNKTTDNNVNEVDAENGEVSVAAETKLSEEEELKQTTECVTQVKQDEKSGNPELKQDSDNNENDANDATTVHSNRDESVEPISKDLDTIENNNSLEPAQSNSNKPAEEKVAAVDVFAAEGENGDTEEASKASEEGASVLLKPADKSSLNGQNDEEKGSPEGLTTADSADLVTNWVTMHQTSKYFETFVEPLEELREVSSEKSNTQSAELPRSEIPEKVVSDEEKESRPSTETEIKNETSDHHSNQSEAKEDLPIKDLTQAEEREVLQVPNIENRDILKEFVIEERVNLWRTKSTNHHLR